MPNRVNTDSAQAAHQLLLSLRSRRCRRGRCPCVSSGSANCSLPDVVADPRNHSGSGVPVLSSPAPGLLPTVTEQDILVLFDDDQAGRAQMGGQPVGGHQTFGVGVVLEHGLGSAGRGTASAYRWGGARSLGHRRAPGRSQGLHFSCLPVAHPTWCAGARRGCIGGVCSRSRLPRCRPAAWRLCDQSSNSATTIPMSKPTAMPSGTMRRRSGDIQRAHRPAG